eukprot:m.78524 g.78524  ORF g.78524 m.78524 type:complete len:105 (+) comp16238_c0_seq3:140-454(+)
MSSSDIGAASDDDLRTSAFKLAAEDPFDATTPKFKPELVQAICERTWDSKTRSSADALALTAEYMRSFVLEAAFRAAKEAQEVDSSQVEPEHLSKALPQLLLDY